MEIDPLVSTLTGPQQQFLGQLNQTGPYRNPQNYALWKSKFQNRRDARKDFQKEFPGNRMSPYQALQFAQWYSHSKKRPSQRRARNLLAENGNPAFVTKIGKRWEGRGLGYGYGLEDGMGYGLEDGYGLASGGRAFRSKGTKIGLNTRNLVPYAGYVREMWAALKTDGGVGGNKALTPAARKEIMKAFGRIWKGDGRIQAMFKRAYVPLREETSVVQGVDTSTIRPRAALVAAIRSNPEYLQLIADLKS